MPSAGEVYRYRFESPFDKVGGGNPSSGYGEAMSTKHARLIIRSLEDEVQIWASAPDFMQEGVSGIGTSVERAKLYVPIGSTAAGSEWGEVERVEGWKKPRVDSVQA